MAIVTLLFTDIVGPTELHGRLGDTAVDELRRRHIGVLRDAVSDAGGREVKGLGDGIMAVFTSAAGAVNCAVAIQRGIAGGQDTGGEETGVPFDLPHNNGMHNTF